MPQQPFDDPARDQTEAVPPGATHSDPYESRHIPPHGDVSPDGRRAYPRPSPLAKWIVWGGTGLAAAALTVGAVIAVRHLAGRPPAEHHSDRDEHPQPGPRPDPGPRLSLMQEIEQNAATLSGSLDDVMRSVTAAASGFRSVAQDANAIMREFGNAADQLRGFMDRGTGDSPAAEAENPHRPFHAAPKDPSADWPAGHSAQEFSELHDEPADHDPRIHRL